jgi:hypothetical protein
LVVPLFFFIDFVFLAESGMATLVAGLDAELAV